MKRIALLFLLITCCVCLTSAQQTIYTPENLPKVHLQDRTRYTCNPENILTPASQREIDRMLYELEQQTGIETVVAVLPSIGETSCFDFCHQLLNEWGVGKKGKNNGLVILLVTDQRCIQFYTGYGLEGDLPDAICKRIQMRYMIPYLKNGQWNEGMTAGVKAVCIRLEDSTKNEDSLDNSTTGVFTGIGLFLGFIMLGGLIFYFAVRTASKCPQCGQHQLQRTNSRIIARRNGIKTEEVTYICQHCGHLITRRQESYDEHYRNRGGNGPIIFGGGGGFGGGSFGGGSFGGGAGGGGGAGSRF